MRFLFTALMFVSQIQIFATSCFTNDKLQQSWNEQMLKLASVELVKKNQSVSVLIKMPKKFEGHTLKDVAVLTGQLENLESLYTLKHYEENGEMFAHYFVNEKWIEQQTIEVTYGSECGPRAMFSVVR